MAHYRQEGGVFPTVTLKSISNLLLHRDLSRQIRKKQLSYHIPYHAIFITSRKGLNHATQKKNVRLRVIVNVQIINFQQHVSCHSSQFSLCGASWIVRWAYCTIMRGTATVWLSVCLEPWLEWEERQGRDHCIRVCDIVVRQSDWRPARQQGSRHDLFVIPIWAVRIFPPVSGPLRRASHQSASLSRPSHQPLGPLRRLSHQSLHFRYATKLSDLLVHRPFRSLPPVSKIRGVGGQIKNGCQINLSSVRVSYYAHVRSVLE